MAFGFMPPPGLQPSADTGGIRAPGHIVFVAGTGGTTSGWLKHFIDTSETVCRELGRPGILVGGTGRRDESRSHSALKSTGFAPLQDVLVGAAAMVHHGGIGTAAAALEAGVPQIAIPRVFRQPSNAEWMRRLGVCSVFHPREWTAANALKHISALIVNEKMKSRAQELATQIDRPASLSAVCSFLENPETYR